jgi:uncharacterized phage protein gp47/JayE
MILGKTFTEILEVAFGRIVESGTITNLNKGGIARTLIEAISQNISDFYTALDINMTMAFVSTAADDYLDMLGYMLNCTRNESESDEDYRYRITQQVFMAADANETSIRLNCLSVDGVRDVVIREFTQGTGTFSVYVIPEDINEIDTLVLRVQDAIDQHKALGVKGMSVAPKIIPLSLSVRIIMDGGAADEATKREVRRTIISYIENLSVGEEFIVTELIQRIMDTTEFVKDVAFSSFSINGKPALLVNQTINWDEKFKADLIAVA